MTEDQLVKLLDVLLVNLHYLPKVRAELFFPSMTQYELLQNIFGNLRDFLGLKVNGCVEHKAIEYVLLQLQLMAERVGHFYFVLLSYQLDKTDEKDENETDEEALIKEEISRVKEDLEHIRSFFRNVEQELHRDLWTRVLDVAYETEHAIKSILARDCGLEETEWIIRKLTSGPAGVDVISIVVDQEYNETKLLPIIFNLVIGLKERFNEDDIEDDVADQLWKELFEKRYLVVLDDMWDTVTWDELTRPLYIISSEFQKGNRVILTSRKKEVALHRKRTWSHFKKGKKEALWIEALNNLSSFIFKDEEEVMKDEDFAISSLKDLWSKEGLVEPTDLKSVEEVTEVYVDELISSSLVIVRGGSEQSCQIHDLVHDFCSIKARKEKMFDLMSSVVLSSSSSSDMMLHQRTTIYDEDIHSDNSSFFGPEKRNLCANLDICMLAHLRSLRIAMKAKVLPPFSNLCNLETLVVDNGESNLLENLATLELLNLSCSVDSENVLERFPNLRALEFHMGCSAAKQIYFPRLDLLNKLERVYAIFKSFGPTHAHQFDFHLPLSLKKVKLHGLKLRSDALSGIGRSLPNLQKLELHCVIADESFPVFEELEYDCVLSLQRSQKSFGDIASLKSLSVCGSHQHKESALKIKEYVEEITGEDKLEQDQKILNQELQFATMVNQNAVVESGEASRITPSSLDYNRPLFLSPSDRHTKENCWMIIGYPQDYKAMKKFRHELVVGSRHLEESTLKIKEYVEENMGEDKLELWCCNGSGGRYCVVYAKHKKFWSTTITNQSGTSTDRKNG
ncbi:putative late blight resistance protein homolog R1B-17 [Capsicum annuum]|uniref:putative late blight resistance protein homolog R1B-17 n=1 Tax=Capsicum annuum TaxID=4072 RepID=UPI001FB06C7C|nr:putative late blight resistance protein homolog R1B-17 [Capsicum annuum]